MQKKWVFSGELFSISLKEELPEKLRMRHRRREFQHSGTNEAEVMNYLNEIKQELKSVHQDIIQLQNTSKSFQEPEIDEGKRVNPREIISNEELSLFFTGELEDPMQEEDTELELPSDNSWIERVINHRNLDSQELEAHADSYTPWRQNKHK